METSNILFMGLDNSHYTRTLANHFQDLMEDCSNFPVPTCGPCTKSQIDAPDFFIVPYLGAEYNEGKLVFWRRVRRIQTTSYATNLDQWAVCVGWSLGYN